MWDFGEDGMAMRGGSMESTAASSLVRLVALPSVVSAMMRSSVGSPMVVKLAHCASPLPGSTLIPNSAIN